MGKIPWRRKWQPAPVFLPGESHGQRSLAGCSPWGRKESDTTERLTHTRDTNCNTKLNRRAGGSGVIGERAPLFKPTISGVQARFGVNPRGAPQHRSRALREAGRGQLDPPQLVRISPLPAPHSTPTAKENTCSFPGCGLSRVTLRGPRTVAHQACPPLEFSRQGYWGGLPFPTLACDWRLPALA